MRAWHPEWTINFAVPLNPLPRVLSCPEGLMTALAGSQACKCCQPGSEGSKYWPHHFTSSCLPGISLIHSHQLQARQTTDHRSKAAELGSFREHCSATKRLFHSRNRTHGCLMQQRAHMHRSMPAGGCKIAQRQGGSAALTGLIHCQAGWYKPPRALEAPGQRYTITAAHPAQGLFAPYPGSHPPTLSPGGVPTLRCTLRSHLTQ